MERKLVIDILPQPDDTTCGPTCLHAVYRYYGEDLRLDDVIERAPALEGGGTLAVMLGCDALERGYDATIYTYNLNVFDPTWLAAGVDLRERLQAQLAAKDSPRLRQATEAYLKFLDLGGEIRSEDLTGRLLRRYLKRGIPILTGLSATYLYGSAREVAEGKKTVYDDVRGEPAGHFVVLCGYDQEAKTVMVADPYSLNPVADSHYYEVGMARLVGAIFLGIVTYDANLLMLEPPEADDVVADRG